MKWLLMRYMAIAHIDSMTELADLTGIARRTLYDRIKEPWTMKVFELKALDDVLHFSDEDIVRLSRGEI